MRAALWLIAFAASAPAAHWKEPWAEPQDQRSAAADSDEYAWRLLVALDWPADEAARRADRAAVFGADAPTVWETWQNTADVYLKDGADPGPWSTGPVRTPVARRFAVRALGELANLRHIVNGAMAPLADPVARAARLTEIRMNRAAFDYIRAHELYDLDGQLAYASAGRPLEFPVGSKEVKATWRPIEAGERSRYHTLELVLADGSTRLYGLSALHIVSKDLPTWFWATFEHVDNPTHADSEGWLLPSRDTFACRGAAPDCNRAPRGIGLEGGVWQYYRLRGTLTRYVDDAQRPQLLANSELERGFQASASCITCHSRAALAVTAGSPLRLPIFDTAASGASTGRGYVGSPDAGWFAVPGAASLATRFQRQDFVWSLSQAMPKARR